MEFRSFSFSFFFFFNFWFFFSMWNYFRFRWLLYVCNRYGYSIQKIPSSYLEISEKVIQDSIGSAAYMCNRGIDVIRSLAHGEDWNIFFKVWRATSTSCPVLGLLHLPLMVLNCGGRNYHGETVPAYHGNHDCGFSWAKQLSKNLIYMIIWLYFHRNVFFNDTLSSSFTENILTAYMVFFLILTCW